MRCILCRGLPGSGKSTFARSRFPGAFHVENDMFHVRDGEYRFSAARQREAVSWCMDMCRAALAAGMDVVVSNTFTRRRYVEAYRKIAEEAGAEFRVYRLTARRGNVHSVPADVMENMERGFEDWPGEEVVE